MEYIKPNKEKHQFLIGIDFGHGETSAAKCGILWSASYKELRGQEPEDIEITPGNCAIHSTLLVEKQLDEKGDVISVTNCIGTAAETKYKKSINSSKIKRDFFAYFKDKPSKMSEKETEAMKCFMREVYLNILSQDEQLTEDNHLVYIACPSNSEEWTEEEKSKYAQIALSAGLPLVKLDEKTTGIIRESRAAFIYVRHSKDEQINTGVKRGILLIDIGSSTCDLTFYSSLLNTPIDHGYKIGASRVEDSILRDIENGNEKLRKLISTNASSRTSAELEVRRLKESFYKDTLDEMTWSINLTSISSGSIPDNETVNSSYSNEQIETLISTYIKDIEDSFKDFKDNYIPNKEIFLIFLTGGASRMPFVKRISKSVFGQNIKVLDKVGNPSTIISRGIALAGRADLRTFNMGEQLLSNPAVTEADIASDTLKKASLDISRLVIDLAEDAYSEFASATKENETTINSLEENVKSKINNINFNECLNTSYTTTLIEETNSKVIDKINIVVRDYFPDFEIPSINTEKKFSLASKASDISTLNTMISSSLSQITEGFIEGLAKLAWNIYVGGTAAAEAVLWNLGVGVVNLFRDKDKKFEYVDVGEIVDGVTINFRDKDTKLSYSKRRNVKKNFDENKERYQSNIHSEILSKLESDKKLVSLINNSGCTEIKKYIIEQIDNARLMLN